MELLEKDGTIEALKQERENTIKELRRKRYMEALNFMHTRYA